MAIQQPKRIIYITAAFIIVIIIIILSIINTLGKNDNGAPGMDRKSQASFYQPDEGGIKYRVSAIVPKVPDS